MTRVTNQAQNVYLKQLMSNLNSKLAEAQVQVTTGKYAQSYSALGVSRSLVSIDMRASVGSLETYNTNIDTVEPRMETADQMLSDIVEVARTVFNDNLKVLRSGQPDLTTINEQARLALENIQSMLNTSMNGRYLFSATDITHSPYDGGATLLANTQAEIAQYMAGAITGADVLTNMNGFTGTDLGFSATLTALPASSKLTIQASESISLNYTQRADSTGISDILRGLSLLANVQYDPALDAEYYSVFDGAQNLIEGGANAVDYDIASLGIVRSQLETARAQNDESIVNLKTYIGEAEDVDEAEAITKMQQYQTQLEISYQTMATLKSMSLVNYL